MKLINIARAFLWLGPCFLLEAGAQELQPFENILLEKKELHLASVDNISILSNPEIDRDLPVGWLLETNDKQPKYQRSLILENGQKIWITLPHRILQPEGNPSQYILPEPSVEGEKLEQILTQQVLALKKKGQDLDKAIYQLEQVLLSYPKP